MALVVLDKTYSTPLTGVTCNEAGQVTCVMADGGVHVYHVTAGETIYGQISVVRMDGTNINHNALVAVT